MESLSPHETLVFSGTSKSILNLSKNMYSLLNYFVQIQAIFVDAESVNKYYFNFLKGM